MPFIFLNIDKITLSEQLYQVSTAIAISQYTSKKLILLTDNVSKSNKSIFQNITQKSNLYCEHKFYEEHMKSEDLFSELPKTKKSIDN